MLNLAWQARVSEGDSTSIDETLKVSLLPFNVHDLILVPSYTWTESINETRSPMNRVLEEVTNQVPLPKERGIV